LETECDLCSVGKANEKRKEKEDRKLMTTAFILPCNFM